MFNARFALRQGVALLALAVACSGAPGSNTESPPAAQGVAVTISPDSATLQPTDGQSFTASVTGTAEPSVTWSVAEGDAGGTITSDGAYTAPEAVGIFHVVAQSNVDPTSSATLKVTVSVPTRPWVRVRPRSATVAAGGSQTFTCVVVGASDKSCTWSVQEGAAGGTITSAGLYRAPSTAGSYHVVAKSHADPTRSDTAPVTVSGTPPPPPVAVTVSPGAVALAAGGSQTFTCSVTGSSDTSCTWSVQEGAAGGTVTSAGLYKAPGTAGSYHVVAKSHVDPTKSAMATATVSGAPPPPPGAVAISVTPESASADACRTATFSASVTGTSNTAVSWSVREGSAGGSVTTGGVYTAPATGGIYHVVATSAADTTKTATSAVTVSERIVSVAVSPSTTSVPTSGTAQLTSTVTTTCGSFTQTQALATGAGQAN